MIPAAILVITFLYFLFGGAFPNSKAATEADEKREQEEQATSDSNVKSNLWLDGTLIHYLWLHFSSYFLFS